jgi:lysophospholipase L1-like esterase
MTRRLPPILMVLALAVVTLLAALSTAACSDSPARPTVAVIGDSITFLSAAAIQAGLTAHHDHVLITGRIGYTAAQLAPDVADFARHNPQVVLFELGTNDVTQSPAGVTSAAAYEQTMAGYRRDFPHACLIATTVGSHRPGATALNAMAAQINTWLKATFTQVVDWDAYEWANRQAGHVLVDGDFIHPNAAGQAALGALDQAAVTRCA